MGQSLLTITTQDWFQRLYSQARGSPLPLLASLDFTERCNLRCVHCYVNQPAGAAAIQENELSLKEWQGIVDQMAHTSVLWLLITGGEPLLRPDFLDFYSYARQKGFHVILFTNGTLLTPALADVLAASPPWMIEITLYGASAETYEAITGVRGSYARCLQGIDLLRERQIALSMKAMALRENWHEIPAMKQMANRWGLSFRYDPMVHSRLNGDRGPLAHRLSPDEIVALEMQDPERLQQWEAYCDEPKPTPDPSRLFLCGAAQRAFHIDAYGMLYACMNARWRGFDLRALSLDEAVRDFLPAMCHLPVTHNTTCWQCERLVYCQNCPAWAWVETGDSEAPDPFRCRLAELRQQNLGLSGRYLLSDETQSASAEGGSR